MSTHTEVARPALRLIVTDQPNLSAPYRTVHEATVDGAVVDPFWSRVIELVEHLKSEYERVHKEQPAAGPTVLVRLLPNCSHDQIDRAFEMIQAQGWDIFPAQLYSTDTIYLRNYKC